MPHRQIVERKRSVKNKATQSEVARHLVPCSIQSEATEALEMEKNDSKRLYKEAFRIASSSSCGSNASLTTDDAISRLSGTS